MNLPIAQLGSELDLLSLLERDFQRWLERDDAAPHGAVHEALWRRAILEPARAMLARPGKLFRARLVHTAHALACAAPEELPAELPLALEVLHIGSLIVDDVQDGSVRRRGEPALHQLVGTPVAINTGGLFYCWALDLVARAGLSAERSAELVRRTGSAMLRCHQGQALDLALRAHELSAAELPALVRSSTRLKSGTLMELAAVAGALAAGASRERVEELGAFGSALGVALQMLDDLSGVLNERRREKGLEDLRLGRPTWVWAWLARDLDERALEAFRARAREVAAGADAEPLLEAMRARLARRGPVRVRRHLDAALEELSDRAAPSLALSALRQEIERLMRSYV